MSFCLNRRSVVLSLSSFLHVASTYTKACRQFRFLEFWMQMLLSRNRTASARDSVESFTRFGLSLSKEFRNDGVTQRCLQNNCTGFVSPTWYDVLFPNQIPEEVLTSFFLSKSRNRIFPSTLPCRFENVSEWKPARVVELFFVRGFAVGHS